MVDQIVLLILTDQKDYFWGLKQRLQSEGYAVLDEYVGNLPEFSQWLNQRPDWDMVIFDDRLPEITVKEVVRLISECNNLTLPVVQVSTSDDLRIALRAMNEGASRFLPCDDLTLFVECVLTLRRESRWLRDHKQAEKEEQEQAVLYRGLVGIYPNLVGMVDMEGRLIKVNANVVNALGFSDEDEILGRNFFDFIHPDDWEVTRANTGNTIREGGIGPNDVRVMRPDGTQWIMEFVNGLIRDEAGNPKTILWVGEDVTEKRAKERELRVLEERFTKVFHANPVAIGIVSLQDHHVIDVNESLCKLLGYSRQELIGNTIFDLNNASIIKEVQAFRSSFTEGVFFSRGAMKIRRRDDLQISILVEMGYFELAGEQCALAVISDISDRARYEDEIKQLNETLEMRIVERTRELENTNQLLQGEILQREQVEGHLRESEERYRTLAENAHDAIFELTRDGSLIYLNQYAAAMLSQPVSEVLGKKITDIFQPVKGAQMASNIQRVYDTGESLFSVDLFPFPSGGIWLSTWLVPLNDQNGHCQSVLGFSRDVSDQQQAKDTLQKAYDQQKELNELKSSFIRRTSHEFRTPLSTILSSAELIENYGGQWSEDKKRIHLHRIQNTVKHLDELLEDLLIVEKSDAGSVHNNPKPIDLEIFLSQAVEEGQLRDQNHHKVTFILYGVCSPAVMDESLLRQVVNNLLANAVKYSLQNTAINLTLRCENNRAIITVEDQGIGIPEHDQPHLFDRFFRGANVASIPGSGLGLPIVKEAVDVMAGKISYSSQVGVGTIFKVELPLIQQPS